MNGKERATKVKYEEKCKDNEHLEGTLESTGMTVEEKSMTIFLAIMKKNSENRRKITYLSDFFDNKEPLE